MVKYNIKWHSLCKDDKKRRIDLHKVLCFSTQNGRSMKMASKRKKRDDGTLLYFVGQNDDRG